MRLAGFLFSRTTFALPRTHEELRREERSNDYEHCSPDVARIVNAAPVLHRVLEREQQEAHAHVIKRAHLDEPQERAHDSLLQRRLVVVERLQQEVLRSQTVRYCEEAEVVTRMETVPECTHKHCYGNPVKYLTEKYT